MKQSNYLSIEQGEWDRRKEFIRFGEQDIAILRSIHSVNESIADVVMDGLYDHFLSHEETAIFFKDPARLSRVKSLQREYFIRLTSGEYDLAYVQNRVQVGLTHQRAGLEPRWYVGAYGVYLQLLLPRLLESLPNDIEAVDVFVSITKIFLLDMELALSTYAAVREQKVDDLANEILEVSTPVVQLWDGVIAVPLIGTLDTQRAQIFLERLLHEIVEKQARYALVDITGVAAMDTVTAQHLLETFGAVRLLGSQLVLTGVRPAIAQTLVQLGIDFEGVVTRASMADGLQYALNQLGLEVRAKDGSS